MSGRLEHRRGDGSAGKRTGGGGGRPCGLLLFLGAVLMFSQWQIVASAAVSIRSVPAPDEAKSVPAPEDRPSFEKKVPAPEPSLFRQLDDAMSKVKQIFLRSPKLLRNLNTVLKTRMDLENKIANRILTFSEDEPEVDEQKIAETVNSLRDKLAHRPSVGYKFLRLIDGYHPNALEDLEDYIRNVDLSQETAAV